MKFRTAYSEPIRFACDSGNGCEPKFRREYDPSIKRYRLICVGQTDVYKAIQTVAEGCDLKSLIASFLAGDPSSVSSLPGSFVDLTSAPKSFLEARLKLVEAEKTFASLDPSVKKLFQGDFNTFLNSCSDGSYSKIIKDAAIKDLQSGQKTPPQSPTAPLTEAQMNYIKENLK